MHFIYPSLLWALAALAIPIIVHLFNFRKAKLVRFSNVKFLEAVKKKSASTRNIKHLLILLARMLFIFFLVITFAQPYLPGAESGLNSTKVDIYLDNSSSMSNITDENISGLTSAVQLAEEILNLYPDDTKFRILTNDFEPSSNNYRSKENTLNTILETDFSNVLKDGDEIMNRLTRMESTGHDIFMITDFQKSTIGQLKNISDSINQFHLIPVSFTDYSNLLVDSVYLKTPFVIDGQRNQLMVEVKNPTDQSNEETTIKLQLNGRQSASISVKIAPRSSEIVGFELDKNLLSINRGMVSIEDYPMTFDNDYYFTFNLVKNIKIIEITETDQSTAVGKVFQDNGLFDYQRFNKGNISYRQVKNADMLVINGLKRIENGLKSQMTSLLAAGKSVVVIPTNESDAINYSEALGFILSRTTTSSKQNMAIPDANHPFFENIFNETSKSSIQPSAFISWQWPITDDPILKSKTGMKFLSQITSRGNLFLFSSSFDANETDFTRNALFVPVMQRIAEKSSAANQQLAYRLEKTIIQIQLDSLVQNELYKLKQAPNEIIPSQKANGNMLLLDLPMYLMNPGFYDLNAANFTTHSLAFNPVRSESELEVLSLPEVEEKFKQLNSKEIYEAVQASDFSKLMKDKYHRMELWKYALILSLLFLVAETLLIRFL